FQNILYFYLHFLNLTHINEKSTYTPLLSGFHFCVNGRLQPTLQEGEKGVEEKGKGIRQESSQPQAAGRRQANRRWPGFLTYPACESIAVYHEQQGRTHCGT